MHRETDFTRFARYTALNVLSMLGLSCYILADTWFISNGIGETGLAALNLSIPVYSLISGVGLMLGVGGSTRSVICRAQGHRAEGSRVFTAMLLLAGAAAAVCVTAGLLFARPLALALGADASTLAMTETYLRVILLFSPAFLANNIVSAFVRSDDGPQLAMAAMLAGCFANILFDYLFIFPLGLGMLGAVLATGFAPLVGLSLLSLHFLRHKNSFGPVRCRLSAALVRGSLPLGVPSLLSEVSAGVVMIVYNLLILDLAGTVGVAAYGIIANIALVVLAIFGGVAQGMQPVLSRAYGLGQPKSFAAVRRYGLLTALAMAAGLYALLALGAAPITALFNRDGSPTLAAIAETGLRLYFTALPFAGVNIVLSACFAAAEQPLPAQLISLLRGFALILPAVLVMARLWQLNGIWLSFPATELLTAAAALLLLWRSTRRTKEH